MELSDILAEESVLACTGVKTKTELLEVLSQHAAQATGLDQQSIFTALSDREALGSTGLGNGIAIPHGKIAGLPAVTALFAKLDQPIDFDSIDDQPVDLVMMLLAPVGAGADHLKALARVARLLRTEALVDDLRRTNDPHKLYRLLIQPLAAYAA
ncbi:PTS sugar transporter subunit IIA [Paradevosia shaoguanensis]|uniref:PTS sugar transporter subunit IIA n=1 Tax=Paradevosia shaoguanensis TaxID=1335043 RepID=A0AA41QHY5_9HYPH|nr:PTS sugar transporter subunit IIA [Paradevosia shaoguanensis]KFL26308.1 nitrogen regulatory protein [Devosia sp. 17-2-E-8]MBI4047926.1 PTS sugar transporter subunit IIA [Devosia nanyangense]QMV03817.1 transcriptional regulator [Devosia sp. D6-9]MCF1740736.1 PTS sugar transporter subunit IIA [Paradevosia shaoguanensis]MCI0125220.1 PTS sugar transporter subunit IIA [Paradevosia shaoguanensis]